MAIPAFTVLELSYLGVVDQQQTLTIRHFENTVEIPGPATAVTMIADLLATMGPGEANDRVTDYLQACATDYTLTGIRLQGVFPTRLRAQDRIINSPGTCPGNTQATNINGTVTLRTFKAGRNQQATYKIPALAEGQYANGRLDAAMRTRLTTLGEMFIDPMVFPGTAIVLRPVIYHRKKPFPMESDEVQTFIVGDTVRVLRRRTVGLGI